MFLQVVFLLFVVVFGIQFLYYLLVFFRLVDYRKPPIFKKQNHPVSVIIAAKNEAENLIKKLPYIIKQNYSNFEVIVVNDGSTDNTQLVLEAFLKNESNLKVINLPANLGKKAALTKAIEQAKNEILIFTDADCKPKSPDWIATMQANFSGYTDLVLGYGPMHKTKGILNKIIRFDTYFIGLQYLSFAIIGKPYMGVGRNMAYRKSLFVKNNGFQSHINIQSGDDDLFVNEVATKQNTSIEISPETHVLSDSKETFSSWVIQKTRHMTTGVSYTIPNKIMLGLFSVSQILFFVSLVILLVFNFKVEEVLMLFFSRLFLQQYVFSKTMKKMGESNLLFLAPFFEIILLVLNPFFLLSAFVSKKKWA